MRHPHHLPIVLIAALVVSLASCSASPDKRMLQYLNTDGFGNRYVGNAEEENYVAIGDGVSVFDTLHPAELVATQRVDIDGTILLPEIGAVHVAGYTRSELEALLTEKYSLVYEQTDINVQIQTQGKKYFVFGETKSEGERPFTGDLTVFEAVLKAKPDKNSANLGRVRLIRFDPVDPLVITVNLGDMIATGDSTFNVHVHERDVIYIPPTMLAQFGYFLDDLLFPVKIVLKGIGGAFFGGGNGGGRNNQAGLFGNIF